MGSAGFILPSVRTGDVIPSPKPIRRSHPIRRPRRGRGATALRRRSLRGHPRSRSHRRKPRSSLEVVTPRRESVVRKLVLDGSLRGTGPIGAFSGEFERNGRFVLERVVMDGRPGLRIGSVNAEVGVLSSVAQIVAGVVRTQRTALRLELEDAPRFRRPPRRRETERSPSLSDRRGPTASCRPSVDRSTGAHHPGSSLGRRCSDPCSGTRVGSR